MSGGLMQVASYPFRPLPDIPVPFRATEVVSFPSRYDAHVRTQVHGNASHFPAESLEKSLVPAESGEKLVNSSMRVVWMKPFAKRLDNNLPHWMQQSRCKANFEVGRSLFSPMELEH
jgi:hypothetical protein